MGTTQIGKSPAIPPPICKNPTPFPPDLARYHSVRYTMYSIPLFTVDAFSSPFITYDVYMLPVVESSHPVITIGIFFSAAANIQEFLGSISLYYTYSPDRTTSY